LHPARVTAVCGTAVEYIKDKVVSD
jgi:hypothetical protein